MNNIFTHVFFSLFFDDYNSLTHDGTSRDGTRVKHEKKLIFSKKKNQVWGNFLGEYAFN